MKRTPSTHDVAAGTAGTVTAALNTALAALTIEDRDGAAVALARTYAAYIDGHVHMETLGDLTKLGPALLSVLESLMMTPRARAAVLKGGTNAPAGNSATNSPVDQLRARRAARQSRATALDAAAS